MENHRARATQGEMHRWHVSESEGDIPWLDFVAWPSGAAVRCICISAHVLQPCHSVPMIRPTAINGADSKRGRP